MSDLCLTEDEESQAVAIRIRGLLKSFSGRTVLGPLDLDLFSGEFVALLGHNGAGKSTLIKIIDGVHTAESGTIEIVGSDGADGSVGVVHQDLGLIDSLSVLDNLRLGRAAVRRQLGYLNRSKERAAAAAALVRFGLDFDLDLLVQDLGPSERALLAVARVAASGPRLIVLDETTSVLSSRDAKRLITSLRANSPAEIAFVMVTHKLDEALALANRIVVLRDGRMVSDERTPLPDLDELTELLAPHCEQRHRPQVRLEEFAPDVLLEFQEVRYKGLGPLNLALHRGEAVAVTGRMGSELSKFGYLAAGAQAADAGEVRLRPGARRAIVPPNREREGNLPELTVRENLTISSLSRWRSHRAWPALRIQRERIAANDMVDSLGVVPASAMAPQQTLSGGNQQKVLFGRALLCEPDVFVLCEPTRGVDVGTRQQIYDLMATLKARGCALLIVASDPQDVLAVSDRIFVLDDGVLGTDFDASELSPAALASLV